MLMSSAAPSSAEEWKEISSVRHPRAVLTVGVAKIDPKAFYIGSAKNVTKVLKDNSCVALIPEEDAPVKAIQVHKDGRIAIARGKSLEIYKNDERLFVFTFEDNISSAAWEGKTLAVAVDSTVSVWDTDTMTNVQNIHLSNLVQTVAVSATSGLILAQGGSHFYCWRMGDDHIQERNSLVNTALSCGSIGKHRAFFGCTDGTCFPVDLDGPSLSPPQRLFGHSNNIRSVHVSADDSKAVSASWDCSLRVWCLETKKALRVLSGAHTSYVTVGRFFGKDDSFVISGSSDSTMKVFDLHQADRERLVALLAGRKDKNPFQSFPVEVLRCIKSILFDMRNSA